MTYLDHDHREGENIGFFARWLPAQDFWRSPPRGVAVPRGTLHGIHILSNHRLAKVCDACVTDVVDEDVWLARRQRGKETRFRIPRTPLRSP